MTQAEFPPQRHRGPFHKRHTEPTKPPVISTDPNTNEPVINAVSAETTMAQQPQKRSGHSKLLIGAEITGALALAGTAFAGIKTDGFGLYSNNSKTDKATTTDAGNLGNNAAPTLDTGKVVVAETPTATPTAAETPTPTPTPEVPKFTYWSKEQIDAAQKNALAKGEVLFLDTWSNKGGKLIPAKTYLNTDALIIEGMPAGTVFSSPLEGMVDGFGVGVGKGFKTKGISIKTNSGIVFDVDVPFESKILVTGGQIISFGSPLIELTGEELPPPQLTGASARGQVIIAEDNSKSSMANVDHLLKDVNGKIVRQKPSDTN